MKLTKMLKAKITIIAVLLGLGTYMFFHHSLNVRDISVLPLALGIAMGIVVLFETIGRTI